MEFRKIFKDITGNDPYPWQCRLYNLFLEGKIPTRLDIPTGLGKTSIIFIWIIAIYNSYSTNLGTRIPSRLVYIVDRRVIVDQASEEARKLQTKVKEVMKDKIKGLTTSTLRGGGGMADNRDWLSHPDGPSIIIGTTDMIGSRLYFSGYGLGNKIKPFYAGLLGQDSLIVLDETHLSPALEQSLRDTQHISQNVKQKIFPPKICLMSATQHNDNSDDVFTLNDEDMNNPEIKKRFMAEKHIQLVDTKEEEESDVLVRYAIKTEGRVLIYLQKPRDVKKVKDKLEKEDKKVVILTGTLRGWERDLLTEDPTYKSFLSKEKSDVNNDQCFLISTSAGEVGVDFDADHMLCDLTTFDSLIQRMGRVNRTGGRTSKITILYSNKTIKNKPASKEIVEVESLTKDGKPKKSKADKKKDPLQETKFLLEALTKNGTYNASSYNLSKIKPERKKDTFASNIMTQPLTVDIIDMWSMTSIYEKYSSRPSVHHWIRGKPEQNMPDTYVAWREDVEHLVNLDEEEIEDVLESYRILPHETARDNSREVYKILQKMKERKGKTRIIIMRANGKCEVKSIEHIDKSDIYFSTILLPPNLGGLDSDGFLSMSADPVKDVADEQLHMTQKLNSNAAEKTTSGITDKTSKMRTRLIVKRLQDGVSHITKQVNEKESNQNLDDWVADNKQMRRAKVIQITYNEEVQSSEEIHYYKGKYDQPQSTSAKPQSLEDHLNETKDVAERITRDMGLEKNLRDAIIMAAKYHDVGKAHEHWQDCMQVELEKRPLAKTGRKHIPLNMHGFRHELASTIKCASKKDIINHKESDLILHLIAAHHGWARPCFKPNHIIEDKNGETEKIVKRYSSLQKRFGAWGLAWLESIVRGSDWQASKELEKP